MTTKAPKRLPIGEELEMWNSNLDYDEQGPLSGWGSPIEFDPNSEGVAP